MQVVFLMQRLSIPLIAGDGIGPEISEAVQMIVNAVVLRQGILIDWIPVLAGQSALDQGKELLPKSTIDAIKEHRIALKGPCTTPVGEGFTSVNVRLRRSFELFAAVRPVTSLPQIKTRFQYVNLIIVRENTEGLYSGVENEITPGVVMSMKVATQHACERIASWAFRYAHQKNRKSISVFHKANIMKMTDGLFLETAHSVAGKDFPDMGFDSLIIDAGCMKLVQDPSQFDVLLLENLYGDVVSDLCAGFVGGLGVVPGANFGSELAIFEAVHGSAPDIAGKDSANPIALLLSAVMMLDYLADQLKLPELSESASMITFALNRCLKAGHKTRDIGGNMGTKKFSETLVSALEAA